MRKNCLIKIMIFVLTVITFSYINLLISIDIKAQTNTSSEYVNTVNDLKTTKLVGGVTLYEQKMSSLLNGDPTKYFEEHYVQWIDVDTLNTEFDLQIATWTYQNPDKWQQATTRQCAEDWEKHHPGWIVVAGTNGDFFRNSGTTTYEPTNNFMADGDMYRADLVGGYRGVIGIDENNNIIHGDPTMTGLQLEVYDENIVKSRYDFDGYNSSPTSDGVYLYTKDAGNIYDFTGYTVYEGKYEICRIDDDGENRVFLKGEIVSSREGKENEKPKEDNEEILEDGTKITRKIREFYIVTKQEQYADILTPGTKVRCQHNYTGEWKDVTQSTGYVYQMLVDGNSQFKAYPDPEDFISKNHPRTFFGTKEDGTPVMMVIDGRGKTAAEKNNGVSLFQGAEIMKLAGCTNAYNFDGGGSSTLLIRDANDEFQVINRPSDGGERSTGNAIFIVMKDPGFTQNFVDTTETSITFKKKSNQIFNDITNVSIEINGKIVNLKDDETETTIDCLVPNTEYSAIIRYTQDGKEYTSNILCKTNSYTPKMKVTSNTYGFSIDIINDHEELKTISAKIIVDDTYTFDMEATKTYDIKNLLIDEVYNIVFICKVLNINSNEVCEIILPATEYRTLDYEQPAITKLEESRKTKDSLRIKYEYKDSNELVKEAYICLNETEYLLENRYGNYTFENLNFNSNDYVIQLKIIYEYENIMHTIYSEKLKYIKPECNHEYDNDCDKDCNLCGATRTTQHIVVKDEKVNATCDKRGLTEGSHCSVCNEIINAQEEIKPLGHSWKEATKQEPKTCTICGKTEGTKLKGCKKASIASIILSINLLAGILILFRKKR